MYKGLFLLVSMLLIACGADDGEVNEVGHDKTPVVSLSKVAEETEDDGSKAITYKVVSDRSPKTDLLVIVYVRNIRLSTDGLKIRCQQQTREFWVTIPKGKKESEDIEHMYYHDSLNGPISVSILPLHIIDVVGEGEVINHEELQYYYGTKTIEGKKIPEDFVFPYYEAENPDGIELYSPKPAKIISVDPPSGSVLLSPFSTFGGITVTFDTPPECPTLTPSRIYENASFGPNSGGKTFKINLGHVDLWPGTEITSDVTISWGPEDSRTSEKLFYTARRIR